MIVLFACSTYPSRVEKGLFGGELVNFEIYDTSGNFYLPLVYYEEITTFGADSINGSNLIDKSMQIELSDLVNSYKGYYVYYARINYMKDTNSELVEDINISSIDLTVNGKSEVYSLKKFCIKAYPTHLGSFINFYSTPVNLPIELNSYLFELSVNQAIELKYIQFSNELSIERVTIKNTSSNEEFDYTHQPFSFEMEENQTYRINVYFQNLNKNEFFYSDAVVNYQIDGDVFVSITPTYFTSWDFELDLLEAYLDEV